MNHLTKTTKYQHLTQNLKNLKKLSTAGQGRGAGTATVTRVLAEKINEDAAPQDRVSGEQLRQKALRHAGERRESICANRTDNNHPSADTYSAEKQEAIAIGEIFDGQRLKSLKEIITNHRSGKGYYGTVPFSLALPPADGVRFQCRGKKTRPGLASRTRGGQPPP